MTAMAAALTPDCCSQSQVGGGRKQQLKSVCVRVCVCVCVHVYKLNVCIAWEKKTGVFVIIQIIESPSFF